MTSKKNPLNSGRAKSPIPRGRKKKSKGRDIISDQDRKLIDDFLASKKVKKSKSN